jgi:Putative prokaryotic signal transducing protein
MAEMEYVLVATFTLPEEAQLASGRLEAEGITSRVSSEINPAFWGFSGLGRVELFVPEEDAERAAKILADCMHLENADEGTGSSMEGPDALWVCSICGDAVGIDKMTCPSCGTSRADITTTMRKSLHDDRTTRRADLQKETPSPPKDRIEGDFDLPALESIDMGDVLAQRALRAAMLGLFFFPIALLAYRCLWQLMFYDGELSPRAMRRLYFALAIDLLLMPIVVVILWVTFVKR